MSPEERIVPTEGGIHGGTFLWSGRFGTLEVVNIGWAARPPGRASEHRTATGHVVFREREARGRYTVAIWNEAHGAAYFSSDAPLTQHQRSAIERVDLFNEGEEPEGCEFRTIFSGSFE